VGDAAHWPNIGLFLFSFSFSFFFCRGPFSSSEKSTLGMENGKENATLAGNGKMKEKKCCAIELYMV
jgi:hypothetical protein